jgi:hypothetical protein
MTSTKSEGGYDGAISFEKRVRELLLAESMRRLSITRISLAEKRISQYLRIGPDERANRKLSVHPSD